MAIYVSLSLSFWPIFFATFLRFQVWPVDHGRAAQRKTTGEIATGTLKDQQSFEAPGSFIGCPFSSVFGTQNQSKRTPNKIACKSFRTKLLFEKVWRGFNFFGRANKSGQQTWLPTIHQTKAQVDGNSWNWMPTPHPWIEGPRFLFSIPMDWWTRLYLENLRPALFEKIWTGGPSYSLKISGLEGTFFFKVYGLKSPVLSV